MGLVGGSIFHSFKGWRSAPKGQALVNMAREVRTRSPLTGVQFAAWGGMFSTIDCCMVYIRKKVIYIFATCTWELTVFDISF